MHKMKIILSLVVILIVVVGFVLLVNKNPFSRPVSTINLSQASVVKEIQSLNRLETTAFTIEKIVEAGQQGNVFQDLLYGDRILLIAHGKVIAGVDLSQVDADDVLVDDDKLTINLPVPTIFSSTLDNSRTRVYDRSQGFLSRGDKDLESEARRAAEAAITQAACESGILEEARENAIERLMQLFQFAGYAEVTVNIPTATC